MANTINQGQVGRIPYYAATGTDLSPIPVPVFYDNTNKIVTLPGLLVTKSAYTGGFGYSGLSFQQFHAGAPTDSFNFVRGRGTAAAKALPQNADELANIEAAGWGGTTPVVGATLKAVVNGTPTSTVMPTEWVFGTHDGTSLADRVKITKAGQLNVNTISNFSGTDLTLAPAGKVVLGLPSKVRITGGTAGQALITDGAGNLSWSTIAGTAGVGFALTSASSVAVGTGTKTFTTNLSAANSAFVIGSRVRVISTATPTTYMEGTITAFATTTMTVSVDATSGTGTLTSWKITIAGNIGATGATGTGRGYAGLTSTTSLAIATGTKIFTVNQAQGTNAFAVGQYVRAFGATPTNFMEGYITAYTTTSLTLNVTLIGGTGTLASWTITASGTQGAAGPTVYPGAGVAVSTGTAWGTSKTSPTGEIVGTSDTQTLTNKRIQDRVLASTADSATPAINTDSYDMVVITAQTANITSMTTSLTGTPVNGQKLWISFTASAGTPTIAWGASFESSAVTLPTGMTTTRSDVGFIWNAATSKWRCVSLA
jgi:hypothetical protein